MAATWVRRLHGHYAICTIGSVTLTQFEWETEIRTDYVDGTGHGDIWDIPIPLKYAWTARSRGYVDLSDGAGGAGSPTVIKQRAYLYQFQPQTVGTPPPDQVTVHFVAYASADTSLPLFSGEGLLTRVHLNAPDGGMAEQEMELRGYGIPSFV